MTKHDLLVLNNSGLGASATFSQALDEFLAEVNAHEGEDIYDAEYGFERGFWSAVKVLTGYQDGN
jgi:hypothetical protein